ncbi:tetraacyldisaccharide 4'-kinase [Winogradskyella sp. A2]|uniref:tetraacyldisaccharide 4'-kinase n=1 Tax=Winogradskyella sp. A2 TaxID=3366944 RepID=UPI00398C3485
MKFIRIILFPIVPIYYIITWLRNWCYDNNLLKSKSYDVPIICVGNLSTGGTGKTPMIEYLIALLQKKNSIATLSRGYKRSTEGFVMADENATATIIGDEPFQFFNKFESITVAVDSDRKHGISQLLKTVVPPNVILLDDAFQHRKVKAGMNILLTSYSNPYFNDFVLPTGNLREPMSGRKRANIVVVTKCKIGIAENEKERIRKRLKLKPHQSVFFSFIEYATIVIGLKSNLELEELPKFTLVTGIANAKPLVEFLVNKGLTFDHIEYPDHHNFRASEIEMLSQRELIITTEKDFMRLSCNESLQDNLYYLPIKLSIDKGDKFNNLVRSFVG